MKSNTLFSLLPLALSFVHTAPLVEQLPFHDDLSKCITQLVLKPDDFVESLPHQTSDMKNFIKARPSIYKNTMFYADGLFRSYLADTDPNHSRLVMGSLHGFDRELWNPATSAAEKQRRLAIYHDSLYSRLHDLSLPRPDMFKERAQNSIAQLLAQLNVLRNVNILPLARPMGNAKELEEWTLRNEARYQHQIPQLQQQMKAALANLPPAYSLSDFKYLKNEEVILKLQEAKAVPHPYLLGPPTNLATPVDTHTSGVSNVAKNSLPPVTDGKPRQHQYVTEDQLKKAIAGAQQHISSENPPVSKQPFTGLHNSKPTISTPVAAAA
ncbi:hypothetical protein O181_005666 [Austropuccinia psidii MF-1]|uniref:Uncharacterized protein n=1 Tax=Austropuccinia psidii MF-1 TaxID=1389203 RepID=A0A9Q3BJA9_9BASI|nr:hypothetical protein [Austropuccinia psidii MF-1]